MTRTTSSSTLLVGVTVPPTFQPALERVVAALRRRNPRATDAQLVDMVMHAGIVFYHDALSCERGACVARRIETHPTQELSHAG